MSMSESPHTSGVRYTAYVEVSPEWILQIATLAAGGSIPTHATVTRAYVEPFTGNVRIVVEHSSLPACHEGELMRKIAFLRTQ